MKPLPKNLTEALYRITVGIRHERHFGIMDSSGSAVDTIIRAKNSPFPKNFFTKIGMGAGRERRIQTADEASYIDITTDDLIFQYTLTDKGFDESFNWIVETCIPFFKDKILNPHHVSEYQRIGIVFGHRIPAPASINEMVSSLTASGISDPETVVLRLSKKLAVPEALAQKAINDYRNVIISLNKNDSSQLDVDVDIQHYFNPFLDHLDDYKGFRDFYRQARELLFNTYHPMLEQKFFPKHFELSQ